MKFYLILGFVFLFSKYNYIFCQESKSTKQNLFYFIKVEEKQNGKENTEIKALYLLPKKKYKGRINKKKFFVKNIANIIYEKNEDSKYNCPIATNHEWNDMYIENLILCCYFPDSSYLFTKKEYGNTVIDTMMHVNLFSIIKYNKYNLSKMDSIKKNLKENIINTIKRDELYTVLVADSHFVISGFVIENVETCECIDESMAWRKKFYIYNFQKSKKLTKEDINLLLGTD